MLIKYDLVAVIRGLLIFFFSLCAVKLLLGLHIYFLWEHFLLGYILEADFILLFRQQSTVR